MDEIAAWVRKQAEADLARDRDLIESEAAAAEWSEPSSGVLVTGPPEHDDTWAGTFAIGDSRIVRHVVAHDPQTEIARAESVLMVLGEFDAAVRRYEAEQSDYGAWISGAAPVIRPCFSGPNPKLIPGLGRTVRLLAYGYRYREGYKAEEWRP